ncbi:MULTISPECIES: iron chelate uptake ABC transporter family permease subunit [Streptomyces]|uniref:Iron chelate uptake ABC transporter family permease subunit n=1 Tax=Streptomyces venezuelae TaxID=54571 RepID=A0A5P2B7X4_STRVZ|nr:iron chelate uptake ABC transporter family permease subunit [Streptomyces venezuelae]MYY84076.1 iron chelate uptake ABC transporter family permease subunit [Streptomyces sp. SID335]MYZ15843.1 iron chelate uptake ABC transporter family permease subunit [Streptomyces sp. SID337]NDZ87573.1 iron chelate uptake ABC transporter family permease subunit [Streptomyces sp. SID10115]NEA06298.1 iron chelate uptake ABC transporter family permease subunit [Streptomyces sp. SID10116]NEB43692.1 iron chelat
MKAIRTRGGLSVRLDVRTAVVVALLVVAALVSGVVLIGTGDFDIPAADVVRTLLGNGDAGQEFIINDLRLPRVLVGLLVGAALGLGGALFQSIARNPLGSPDVLGLGQGSTAGALTMIVLFQGSAVQVAAGALVGGLVTGLAIYLLAWKRGVHGYRLVLVGIGVSAFITAINGYLLTKADFVDAARAVVWMTGSLNGRDWEQVWPLLVLCAVLVPLVLLYGRPLRMLEMGDDAANSLGVRVERTRFVLLGASVLLTAAATAAAGPVSFVALTAPQLARRLTRAPGPNLMPAMFMGATLLIVADWASQRAFGADQLPVGVVTGVLGGVYLLWLLVSQRKAGRI